MFGSLTAYLRFDYKLGVCLVLLWGCVRKFYCLCCPLYICRFHVHNWKAFNQWSTVLQLIGCHQAYILHKQSSLGNICIFF